MVMFDYPGRASARTQCFSETPDDRVDSDLWMAVRKLVVCVHLVSGLVLHHCSQSGAVVSDSR